MAKAVANVDVLTETFNSWLLKTNIITDALSLEIITANSTYANTGSPTDLRTAQLFGTFGANTLIATNGLQGGNNSSSANLNITSNVIITGITLTSTANSLYSNTAYFTANISSTGSQLTVTSNVSVNSTSFIVQGNTQQFKSNTSITALQISGNGSSTNTAIGGTDLNITANIVGTGTLSVVGAVNITNTIAAGNTTITGFANVSSYANVGGALSVVGAVNITNTIAAGNTTITGSINATGSANLQSSANVGGTLGVVGITTLSSSLGVSGAVNITNTIAAGNTTITGFANVSGSLSSNTISVSNNALIGGTLTVSNTTLLQSNYFLEVVSNTDIGASIVTPLKIYSFPTATYASGKLMVQVKATGNVQMSEMVLAHDGTTAYFSQYGTVASPGGGASANPLGSYTCLVNATSSSVELYLLQTITHSATKVVAHLMK